MIDLEVVPVPVARLETRRAAPAACHPAYHAGPARERGHRLPRQARCRPRPGRPAQAGAHLAPRGVPARIPGRDRRPVVPAARHGGLCARAAAAGRHVRRRRGRAQGGRRHRRRHRGARTADTARPARSRRAHRQQRARRGVADRDGGRAARGPAPPRPAWWPRPRRRSACTSTRSASGSRWSTSAATIIDDERALLVVLDLVAAESRGRHGGATRSRRPGSPSRWPPSTVSTSVWIATSAAAADRSRDADPAWCSAATGAAASSYPSSPRRTTASPRSCSSSGSWRAPS